MDSSAQTHLMGNGSISTCSGTFYDSGGNAGNYANNENFTMTICSSVPGNCIRLNFTFFDLENTFDEMTIYNGPTTASPLVGIFTGNVSPGLVTGSSGCLTIVFTSDAIVRAAGWEALVSCVICSTPGCATTCNGGAAPSNDACSGAINLGVIPAPSPCPGGIGALSSLNTTNLCANPEFPYTSLLGCQPAGNMGSPAADVWYRFTITGPSLNISLSGGLITPNIGLYEGNTCVGLIPRGCAIGAAGNLNATFTGLAAGSYFLQVSGGNVADQCNFNLTLQNNYDCAGCVIQSYFTAVPPPVNGMYPAGQLVNFCYTISDYNQTSANWLHGIVPTLGPGWDMSTFIPGSVTNCSGAGTWNWYNTNVTSSATGNVTGPGFYYESNLGNAGGVVDGNPGNNFGDNNGGGLCDWTFCFSVRTIPIGICVPGTSLNINIDTYGDGESGSWTSVACTQDPITNFFATLNCCQAPTVVTTDPLCLGQNTGTAVATGMGLSPWDYIWTNSAGTILLTQNNIAGTSTLNGLAPGNYIVSVTDNNGCTSGSAFTITAAPAFSAVMNTTNLTCNNSNNGTASLVINGGTPGFTYAWSPSGTGASPIALAANNYTVTITDANGCTAIANGTITQPAIIVASTATKTNVDCNGGQNGSITVSTAGGTPGYTYSWSNGAAGPTISSLTAGAYTVTVTDSRGCTGFMTVGITQPTPIVLAMSSTAASCGTNNGTASVAALGGTPGYSYAWSPSGGVAAFASGLGAGVYNVTVTDSKGCTMLGNTVVSNSSGPTTTIASSVNVTCFGGNDGSATANVVGGAPPIVYSWTPSGGVGISASGLAAGNYTITATDAAGCTSAASVVISSSLQLTAVISNSVPVSCSYENDGSLTVQGSGGTPVYSYNWSGGSVNATDNNLLPGTYTVTITDGNGCTASTNGTVNAPALLQVNILSNTPVSCNLGIDGSTTVAAVGGTLAYSYLWSNGTVGATNSGLSAGTYTVTATDVNGCIATQSVVITQSTPLNLVLSSTGTTCGGANGTTSVIVNGGTPGYSYSWSPSGGTNSSASGLNAGNYSVLVTDANGCTAIGNISVPSANGPVLSVSSSNNITCPSGNDGGISINVAGGATPYTYSWSNGGVGNSINLLAAGIYTLTVTDNNSCSSSIIVNLTEPIGFSFVDVSNSAHCGQADGDLTITASGGTSPYTYSWSNGASGSNQISNIVNGTYTVTVSDVNGCTAISSGVIVDVPAPTITLNNSFDASCFGGADGRIRVNVVGGVPPYNLLWSNGAVGLLNNNIAAGTYTVTVTDAVGCTASFQSSISEPTAINLIPSSTLAICGSANGSASVVANGGTGGYAYAWSPIGGNGASAANLGAGSYTVVVTDANGCTEQMNVNVGSSNGPSTVVLLQTDVSCNGGNDGALTISVNGGATPYVYAWSASGSGTSGVGLTAGNYSVTVTDANGCSSMVSATINEPTALSTVPNSYTSHCGQGDGGADILVNGGTPVYAYTWSTGTSVNNTLSNVPAGSYTVTVSDANGCTFATTVTIPNQAGPVVNVATINPVTCNNGNDGSVSVGIVGGNNPFNYVWSNSASSATNSNLTAGNYTVTITDAFGCTSTLVANITEPAIIPLSFVNTISTCGNSNGSSVVTPNGGIAPYSYNWSSGSVSSTANALSAGVYTVTVTDAQGCTVSDNTIINSAGGPTLLSGGQTDVSCAGGADGTASVLVTAGNGPFTFDWLPSGGITANATGLSVGNYKVSVTDINGCSTTLNYNILEPLPLLVNNLTTPVTCNGGNDGTANIDAQDGTAPYVYDWNPGGISTANRINLSVGNYDVTVTDAKGCTEQTTAVVAEPQAISGVPSVVDADCFGGNTGSASIVAAGGLSPYTFLWNTGASSSQITNLIAGSYTVTISDNNGCPHPTTIVVGEASIINVNTIVTDASCGNANGTAQVNANGGTGAFGFQWSTGAATTSINGLTAGAYTVIATDANGCTATTIAAVANLGGPALSILSTNDISCNGGADGNAEVTVNSGNGPYTYSWIPSGGNAALATGLLAGAYAVNVTDANGCITSINVNLTEPTAIQLVLSVTPETCGNANGTSTVLANGGTGAYSYVWSNGDLIANATSLSAGNYSVIVTDINGCTEQGNVIITTPTTLTTNGNSTPATCFNGNDGSATVNTNGGTAPFNYAWSNGANTAIANGLTSSSYTVTVSDVNGCTAVEVINVGQAAVINLVTNTTPATCGASNGDAAVVGNGGTGALTYAWSTGQAGLSINTLAAGSYTVTATDASGCTVSTTAAVANLGGPTVAILNTNEVSCFAGNNGNAEVVTNAGNGPFTYQWIPSGGNTTQATGLVAGNYTAIVTDVNGCVTNTPIQINEPTALQLQLNTQQATCGLANGTTTAVVSGGTGGYNYNWSNGASGSNSINSLMSGNYSVTITDANGCTLSNSTTISNAGGATLAVTNVTPASCNGYSNGSASIIIVGGNGPFNYNWLPSGGNSSSAAGLAAGNYTLSVTDVNGCVTQQVVVILEPTPLASIPTTTPTQCNASNGSAQVQISGGTGAYSYNWNNGQNSNTATGLTTGNYTVTVSDVNGCTLSSTLVVNGLPGPSIDNVSTSNALCFGAANGSAQAQVSSGSAPYNYTWSNGSNTPTANGLNAGNYAVTVTDNFGCTDADVFTIQEPQVLSATTQPIQMVSCFGGNDGSANTNAVGGTSPYAYTWSTGANTITANNLPAGTYSVIITDQNGCTEVQSTTITEPTILTLTQNSATMVSCFGGSNGAVQYAANGGTSPYQYLWSNGITTANNTNLTAGNYTIVLTDAKGCTSTSSVNISQPTLLAFNPSAITNVNCFNGNNGQATVSSNGGVAPYTYQWSNGSANATLQNLIAGNYSVTVTDANGCTSNQTIQVTQPTAIAIQPIVNGIPCFGMSNASINIATSGGVGPYSYSWSNGSVSNVISTIPQGIYTVQILDAHLCPFDTTFTIIEPTALQASVNHPDTICIGQSTSLVATVSGGTAGYNYLWNTNHTASNISVNPSVNNLYSVLVTDANGCTKTVSNIPVLVFPALSINMTVTEDSICEGESTALAAIAAGGNGGPYTYTWNAIGTNVNGFNSSPDSTFVYSVSLSDGCTVLEPSTQQLVIVHPLPIVNFTPIDQKGCNPVTVNFTSTSITTNGANYVWNFGDGFDGNGNNISHTYVEDGTYDVSLFVTDIYGCESQLTQNNIITVWPLPTAFYTSEPQEVSILHPTVQFLNGSNGAVTSHWDFGDNTVTTNDWSPEHTYGDTGRYVVELIVISNEGCVDTFYNEIIVRGETTFYLPNAFSPNNDGYNEFFTGYGIGITHANFKVFDRWGKLMFESNDLSKGWDGTYQNSGDVCAEGVYIYLFKVYNGQPAPLEFTGKVSLVR